MVCKDENPYINGLKYWGIIYNNVFWHLNIWMRQGRTETTTETKIHFWKLHKNSIEILIFIKNVM